MPICFYLIINNSCSNLVIFSFNLFASSKLVGHSLLSILNLVNIFSVSSIILYASFLERNLNKSLFPSFGIKFSLPSEKVPAPPKPDNIEQGLQYYFSILVFTFNSIVLLDS